MLVKDHKIKLIFTMPLMLKIKVITTGLDYSISSQATKFLTTQLLINRLWRQALTILLETHQRREWRAHYPYLKKLTFLIPKAQTIHIRF